jgi:hypothetical protein
MKALPLENLKKLIEQGGFGTYRLFAVPGNELVASAGTNEEEKPLKMSTGDLMADIEKRLDALGTGEYRIHLKKSPQSASTTEMVYRFKYVDSEDETVATQSNRKSDSFHGLGSPDKLEDLIERRVSERLALEKEKNEIRDQMKELLWKMKEMETSRRRRPAKNQLGFLNGLVDVVKIGAVTFIAEKYPASKEMVLQTLKTMASPEEEEEEEEEEETGFIKPTEE